MKTVNMDLLALRLLYVPPIPFLPAVSLANGSPFQDALSLSNGQGSFHDENQLIPLFQISHSNNKSLPHIHTTVM
jgi:hypothetical protein